MAPGPDRGASGGELTPLDRAHARMIAAGETEAARRAFFAALAAAELVLVLEEEPAPGSDRLSPLVLETGEGAFALAFDTDARMAGFLQGGAPMAALSGRDLAAMLAAAGIGLALNLEVAPSAMLLPPEAMDWVGQVAPAAAEVAPGRIAGLRAPEGVDPGLLDTLGAALARLSGRAEAAHLVEAAYSDGSGGLLLVLEGVAEDLRPQASEIVAGALALAGFGEAALDLTFAEADAAILARVGESALTLAIPKPRTLPGTAPGTDPAKPPRLI